VKPLLALLAPYDSELELSQIMKSIGGFDDILEWLSGDIAIVAQPGVPIPEFTFVFGLKPNTYKSLSTSINKLLIDMKLHEGRSDENINDWTVFTPIGQLTIHLTDDRVVFRTGNAEIPTTPTPRNINEALTIDIDLPALSHSYLPMLIAMMDLSAKPEYIFHDHIPLLDLVKKIRHFAGRIRAKNDSVINFNHIETQQIRAGFSNTTLKYDWERVVGRQDLPMQNHIAFFSENQDNSNNLSIIYKELDGWCMVTLWGYYRVKSIQKINSFIELEKKVSAWSHLAGAALKDLQVVSIPVQPSLDRRWLPPVAAIIDHMPAYRFRLQATADGFSAVEDGLPVLQLSCNLVMPFLVVSGMQYFFETSYLDAVLKRYERETEEKHQRAIKAIALVKKSLRSLKRDAPILWTPSSAFVAVNVSLEELASLNNGVAPTAEQVDKLGFWWVESYSTDRYQWLIPVENDLFIEVSSWSNSARLTARSNLNRQPMTQDEINKVQLEIEKRQRGRKKDADKKAPVVPPPKTDDANEF
jgi:hypothetical protein